MAPLSYGTATFPQRIYKRCYSSTASFLSYTYTAQWPETGEIWQIPRTEEAEAIARGLMEQLAADSTPPQTGKLYGILLVETATGDRGIIKAFSGLLAGQSHRPGWVPPLPSYAQIALVEPQTLARLDQLKAELMALKHLPAQTAHGQLSRQYNEQLQQLAERHRERKQRRDRTRTHHQNTLQGDALAKALDQLKRESQQDSVERRQLKQTRDQVLAPLTQEINQVEQQIKNLKQQYTKLSREWQTQLQTAYAAERAGVDLNLKDLVGSDDSLSKSLYQRAAAKLLHYAATHSLKPLTMAEFWWGNPTGDYSPGQFYGASPETCHALMTIAWIAKRPRLVNITTPLNILYQDEALIVVDKPAGFLSVPGRRYYLQDSVLSRLQLDNPYLQVVHRLDQATSGILVLAKSPDAHTALGKQFSQRQVHKTYEALLSQPISRTRGTVELPLWSNPDERPKQSINGIHGKPSVTHFQVLQAGEQPRVQFVPYTGRTHQLRVHAAHRQGLNSPILGDSLYGQASQTERLHLHATSLRLTHPITQKQLEFTSDAPF